MLQRVNFDIEMIQVSERTDLFRATRITLTLLHEMLLRARSQSTQDTTAVYLGTPNCRHTATLAVDSLFLSTLKEHSCKAKAGEVLCMRCGNI